MSTFNAKQLLLPVASLILNLTFLTHFEYSSLHSDILLDSFSQEGWILGNFDYSCLVNRGRSRDYVVSVLARQVARHITAGDYGPTTLETAISKGLWMSNVQSVSDSRYC
jgi:hypothetical protein